ncbi:unnamed protein product [Phytophthora fragariaefolia]|uniref:Unnamed protein product n=1 Tax=Phytophthora fragariaefolia TaxID=1490495 RepID=A0A9W6U8J6_9STRA|nr:unnamed protein product [Phytophthora fragariaefolia]
MVTKASSLENQSRRYQSPVAMSSSPPSPSLPAAARDSAIERMPTSALSPTATPLAWSTPCSSSQAASQAVGVPLAQATVESDAESAEELAIDEVDSNEPDDSADKDWSTGDASIEDEEEEALTGERAEREAEVEEDISNSLFDFAVQQSRYKWCVLEGNIAMKLHGNKLDKNASKIDAVWLVKWFTEFAVCVGEVVPVRVRTQKTKGGVVKKHPDQLPLDEVSSGKGSDQVNSMMHHFIRTVILPAGKKRPIVYADNCSGQNKNNRVIKFFLAQAHMDYMERVDYKFFVKGHAKKSCDRGFGHIRKHISRTGFRTMQHFIDAVNDAATYNTTAYFPRKNSFFKSYKPLVTELYRALLGVQQCQMFTVECSSPGVVQCKKGPEDELVKQDLRRKVDGILTESDKVGRMLTHFLENLSHPPQNTEKMLNFHNKIRKYVPDEFHEDAIYAAPSVAEEDDAKAAKQARREHRAAMAKAAKQNSDRRAASANEAGEATKKRKTGERVFAHPK